MRPSPRRSTRARLGAGVCERISPGSFTSTSGGDLSFVYFSFATLTTLGYGDVVPVNQAAGVLTNIEALAGQVFLAVFVARLVGLYIATESKKENNYDNQ